MQTGLQLRIMVPDDGVIGDAKLLVWREEDSVMCASVQIFEGTTILPTLDESGDHYQFAVTALRDIADRVVASLLKAINEGTEKPMLQYENGLLF